MHVNIENISRSWDGFSLKNISLKVQEGEYFIFLGPCGAGKTLLLSTIAGLYRPDSGRILIAGEDVTFLPPEKRNIGYLFQKDALFPHLSVKGNIFYGLRYKKADDKYTESIFNLLDIEKLLSRDSVIALSGGEMRKVALARSLVVKPRLLLLDEPLAFLDPISQQMVTDTLKAINKNTGITIIHVTHMASETRQLGDHAAVLVDGSILQTGAPKEIIDNPHEVLIEKYWGRNSV